MFDWLQHLDMEQMISAIGYVGVLSIIFLETGVFLGFFLPGDSLLFIAGMLAAKGVFDLAILVPALIVVAFLGYALGYWFGDKLGHWLLARKDGLFFKRRYLTEAHKFYEKHGGKALMLGRLVPIARTFVPIVAGMAGMPKGRYTFYNIFGAIFWCGGVTCLGYLLGGLIPNASDYILPVVVLIVLVSILPGIFHFVGKRFSK